VTSKDAAAKQLARARRLAVAKFLRDVHRRPALAARHVSAHPAHNVVGIGIGPRLVKGKRRRQICVRLYVRHKLGASRVPKRFYLPATIGGVPTDVIEVGTPKILAGATSDTFQRMRPARPGCCITAAGPTPIYPETQGTFGAVVSDAQGTLYLLSNNHVLANEDYNKAGTAIFQPNGPDAADRLALLKTVVPLNRTGLATVDCALAKVIRTRDVNPVPLEPVGPLSSAEILAAATGMNVEKFGATTGHTTGTVTDTDANFVVEYDDGAQIHLAHQIHIENGPEPFCDGGDSGSLVVESATKQAIALLTVNMDGFALACDLGRVLQELSARLGSKLTLET
jgi:S1-C subfamily serine protease